MVGACEQRHHAMRVAGSHDISMIRLPHMKPAQPARLRTFSDANTHGF
jgi:hypothetical protein